MLNNDLARKIAQYIILSHAEDIEWLSINEMTSDTLAEEGYLLSDEERENFLHTVDAWISKATVTVTFEERDDVAPS